MVLLSSFEGFMGIERVKSLKNPARGLRYLVLWLLCSFLLTSVPPTFVLAQGRETIDQILIRGNRRIRESTILYYIQTRERDEFDRARVLRDFRTLLNTNFFEDATLKRQDGETGVILIFEVKERPLIRNISYDGIKSVKESDILEKFREARVGLTVDSAFDPAKLSKGRKVLKDILAEQGRPLARVEVETEPITSYALNIIFKGDEGPKVRIGKISFEGNSLFSEDELRESLELNKERGPITLFKGHDKYIEEKLEYDVHTNLLAKYKEHGYIEARAGEPKVEIVEAPQGWLLGFRKTKQQYYVTIPIDEGSQYHWGIFKVQGVKSFIQEGVENAFGIRKDEIVNYKQLQTSIEDLKKLYSRTGYLDMDTIPEMNVDEKEKRVDLTLTVNEGKQYLVDRITFEGNTKTRDKVMRREFILQEQGLFNGDFLDYSVQRLNQLGFFEKIEEKDYEVIKRPERSEVEVLVKVKERSHQSIGFTAGVSGIYGGFIGVNYGTNNFRGLGQQLQINLLTGSRTANYRFSFTEPYFMDSKFSLGGSVFNQRFRYDTYSAFFGQISPSQNIPLYTQYSTGGSVRTSYPLWRWTRVGLSYTLSNIRIGDVDELYEDFAFNQLLGFTPGGSREEAQSGIIRSEIRPSLSYDTRDSYFGARRGTYFFVHVPVAGGRLGGSYNVVSPWIEYQKFIPDRWISGGRNTLAFRTKFRHLIPFGELPDGSPMSVPFFERIYAGGEFDIRAFNIRTISPWAITRTPRRDVNLNPIIDPATGLPAISNNVLPVGGDTSVAFTLEYRIPIVGPLQVTPFADLGTSTVLRKDNLVLFGPGTFIQLLENTNNVWRASTGVEVQFLVPMINQPFRLIFGYNPLILDTFVVLDGIRFPLREERTNVRFTVGYSF